MTLVKICGLKDAETAIEAAKAGADFIGIMFAESKRRVTPQQCHDIVEAIKAARTQGREATFEGPVRGEVSARTWFGAWAEAIDQSRHALASAHRRRVRRDDRGRGERHRGRGGTRPRPVLRRRRRRLRAAKVHQPVIRGGPRRRKGHRLTMSKTVASPEYRARPHARYRLGERRSAARANRSTGRSRPRSWNAGCRSCSPAA